MASENITVVTKDSFEKEVEQSDVPVLVDFWASWCGPCRMIAPLMSEIADEYTGKAKVCKINVDDEGDLAVKFRVMSIPTVMLFKNGTMVERVVGARSKEEFKGLIDKNL